jgi:tetratricopeptide (TPR) repeat protein
VNPSHKEITRLFQEGEFLKVVYALRSDQQDKNKLEPGLTVILANALALTGSLDEARKLAELCVESSLPHGVRAHAEMALSVVGRRTGNHNSALRHAQRAAQLAKESKDVELVAWTALQFFRLLIDNGSIDAIQAALPDVRRAVERAGSSRATAYLHNTVSVLEGQAGRLDEARRHSELAEQLLDLAPNFWLRGAVLLNQGVMAVLDCEFDKALNSFELANAASSRSGHLQTATAVQSNIAHLHLLVGDFARARDAFSSLMTDPSAGYFTRLAAADGLSRVHLALGE